MSKRKLSLALIALACLGVAIGLGWADNNVLDHSSYFQNATNGAKTDATGNAYVTEFAKDRDNWRVYPNIIRNQLNSTTAGVDSSVALDTHDMKKLWLVLVGQFDTLSNVVRVAVQVRGHYSTSTDSSMTFPWRRWPFPRPATPVTVSGLVWASGATAMHLAAAAASLGGLTHVPNGWQVVAPTILPGTYVVSHNTSDSGIVISSAATFIGPASVVVSFYPPGTYQASAGAPVDSIGDLNTGVYAQAQTTDANSSQAQNPGLWNGEFMVKFNMAARDTAASGNGKYGGGPNGMWIPLQDYQGVPFQAPYTSVRIRLINGAKSRFVIRADLVGSSL